jgi:hypothetical protein
LADRIPAPLVLVIVGLAVAAIGAWSARWFGPVPETSPTS